MSPLTGLERQVLDTAKACELLPDDGSRHRFASTTMGMSYTAYLQYLNRLLDSEAALAAEPGLVYRLRRRRDNRNVQRGHVA